MYTEVQRTNDMSKKMQQTWSIKVNQNYNNFKNQDEDTKYVK